MTDSPSSKERIEHPVFTLALNCATREQLIETIRQLHTQLEHLKQRAADEPKAPTDVLAAAERIDNEIRIHDDDRDSHRAFTADLRTLIAHARAAQPPTATPALWILDDNGYIASWYTYDPVAAGKKIGSGKLIPLYTAPQRTDPPEAPIVADKAEGTDVCRFCYLTPSKCICSGEPPPADPAAYRVDWSGKKVDAFGFVSPGGLRMYVRELRDDGMSNIRETPLYRRPQPADEYTLDCIAFESYGDTNCVTLEVPADWRLTIGEKWTVRRAPSTKGGES